MKNRCFVISLVGAIMAFLACSGAYAAEPLHARVSYEAGDAMIKGGDDADWSYATVNTLVLPGDVVWSDKDGTIEVEMAGGTFLRMADGSKAEITSLPPSGLIRGWTGSFYIQRTSRSSGSIKFQTPVCTVEVVRDSQVRLDLVRDGATTITVRWGRAYVSTEGGGAPLAIERGTRTYVDPGYLPSDPMPFDLSAEDAFDAWSRERTRLIAVGNEIDPPGHAVKNVPIGYDDLATSGEWIHVDSDYCWRPTVVVDFVPYRSGHWSFVAGCGYVWVGDYPFSYVTSHYGRWRHHDRYGWIWSYRDEWSPAWVYSCRVGSNFVWAPLDPWDRPCVYGSRTDIFVLGDGLSFSISTSTYCPVDTLLIGPCPVIPLTPIICRDIPRTEINIWNINVGHRPTYARSDNVFQVRDYSPRRMIRGLETFGDRKDTAPIRARALETQVGRTEFAPKSIQTRQSIRTSPDTGTRSAQVRDVKINRQAFSDTHIKSPRTDGIAPTERGRALSTTTTTKQESTGRLRAPITTQDLPKPMRPTTSLNAQTDEQTQDTLQPRYSLRNRAATQEQPKTEGTSRLNTRESFPTEPQTSPSIRGRSISERKTTRETVIPNDDSTRSTTSLQNRTTEPTVRNRETIQEIQRPSTTRSQENRQQIIETRTNKETTSETSPFTRSRQTPKTEVESVQIDPPSRNSRIIEQSDSSRTMREVPSRETIQSTDSNRSTSNRSRDTTQDTSSSRRSVR